MPAYVIARVDVTDPDQYAEYREPTPAAVAAFGGKFIVEGPEETRRVVVIQFESMDRAREFYNSDTYQAAKALRDGAADGHFILVDGHDG